MIFLLLAWAATVLIYSRSIDGAFLFDDHAISDFDFPRRWLVFRGFIDWDDPGNRESPPRDCVDIMTQFSAPVFRPRSWRRTLRSLAQEPRALTHLGYLITWKAAGLEPRAWHAVNVALHMANTGLVFLLCRTLFPSEIAGAAALLFAVHPHQVAAVSYISARASLQSCFFALLAVLSMSYAGNALSILAIYLAIRSKEDGGAWSLIFFVSYKVLSIWRF
jgi:hypothetical protein